MEDCFANYRGKCIIFKSGKCEGMDCGFYKTKEQQLRDRKKSRQRILSLDEDVKKHIVDKYYQGKMELLEEEI